MQIGYAQNYSGGKINVSLSQGKTVLAIPQGDINSTKVIVFKAEDGNYYCRCATEPIAILKDIEISREIPETGAEAPVEILPFQVLTSDLILGGDREIEDLSELTVTLAGITNIGDMDYLAAWYNENNRNVITPQGISSLPGSEAPEWHGYGQIGIYYQYEPEENLVTVGTGVSLPPDLPEPNPLYRVYEDGLAVPPLGFYAFPEYPVFFERSSSTRVGTKTTTQEEDNYTLSISETWDYQHKITGTAPNPAPGGIAFFAVCNGLNAGLSFPQFFQRQTKANYTRDTNSSLQTATEFWLNGQVFSGDRIIVFTETYEYDRSPALFIASETYVCNADPNFAFAQGFFDPISASANWTTEIIKETREYSRDIVENAWDYPISLAVMRNRNYLESETYSSILDYEVGSDNWQLSSFIPAGFSFEVTGIETQRVVKTISVNSISPSLLLLGATGRESLFVETISDRSTSYTKDRVRQINKELFNYSTQIPQITSSIENTNIAIADSEELYFCDGSESSPLNLKDSFCFKVSMDLELSLDNQQFSLILANSSDDPIIAFPEEVITAYTKTEEHNQEPQYNNVLSSPNPLLKINGSSVYVVSGGFRASGVISQIDFYQEENLNLPIENIRTVEAIRISIESVEQYPEGLAQPREVLIYSSANVAALLYQELLKPGNKQFCNLVGASLYYSKGIINYLQETTQVTQVYRIVDGAVLQEGTEEGAFIPMAVPPESVISVSYYPV